MNNNILSSSLNFWGAHLLTLPVSTYVTEGIAKICGFEVLRHGTSFPQYFGILQNGADPSRGGEATGIVNGPNSGYKEMLEKCKNRFHVFKDSTEDKSLISREFFKRFMPRAHAVIASVSLSKGIENRIMFVVARIFFAIMSLMFCPTIRFVYKKDEIQECQFESEFVDKNDSKQSISKRPRFIDDKYYGSKAYSTPDPLPNDRIGLIGVCKHAQWSDVKHTFKTNPKQVMIGTAQLIVGVALTCLGVGIIL